MDKNGERIVSLECPECHATLWIDLQTHEVVQHKKSKKKTFSTLEEMLVKEKQKKERVDERFVQAKTLEQNKRKKAEELFNQKLKED